MGIINIVKNIKQVHKYDIVLVKVGNFFNCYGRDAYIISYLFQYKICLTEEAYYVVSFPKSAYNKVIAGLENKRINYLLLDKRNNYEVDERSDNKNLNQYEKIYNKAKEKIATKMRIEKIYKELEEKQDRELISIIEKVIYERRKVQSN